MCPCILENSNHSLPLDNQSCPQGWEWGYDRHSKLNISHVLSSVLEFVHWTNIWGYLLPLYVFHQFAKIVLGSLVAYCPCLNLAIGYRSSADLLWIVLMWRCEILDVICCLVGIVFCKPLDLLIGEWEMSHRIFLLVIDFLLLLLSANDMFATSPSLSPFH